MADVAPKAEHYDLVDGELEEIALVPKGANQHAHIRLAKIAAAAKSVLKRVRVAMTRKPIAKDGPEMPRTVGDILGMQAFWSQWWTLRDAMETSVREIMECECAPAEKASMIRESMGQFVDALEAACAKMPMPPAEDAGGEQPMDMVAKIDATLAPFASSIDGEWTLADLTKTLDLVEHEANAPSRHKADVAGEHQMKKTLDEILKGLPEAERAIVAEEMAALKKSAEKPADVKPAEVLPAHIQKQLDDERAERTKLQKALDEERETRIQKEFEVEVSGYVLPGLDNAKAVSLLKSAHLGRPVAKEDLRAMFVATSAVVKEHNKMLKQMGYAEAHGDENADTAFSEVNKRAKALMTADPSHFTTIEKARVEVRRRDSELVARERAEAGEANAA